MITDMATVKTLARIPETTGEGVPTDEAGAGDIYMDTDTGLTYEYDGTAWQPYTEFDGIILLQLAKVEADYLRIRGVPFEVEDGDPVYPDGSNVTAAEMVCYLTGIGDYEGRGKQSEGLAGRSASFDSKIFGYPASIVGTIKRYVGTQ